MSTLDLIRYMRNLILAISCLVAVVQLAHCQTTDPVGTYMYSPSTACPGSGSCYAVSLSCPIVSPLTVLAKVTSPTVSPIGTVVLTTGGGGADWYERAYVAGAWVISSLTQAGYTVVQPNFTDLNNPTPNGWLQGRQVGDGPRRLACRYATMIRFIQEVLSVPSKPVCATGNSNGSAAIAYALAHYGLGDGSAHDQNGPLPLLWFTMAEITSGPTLSRLDHGCECDQAPILTPCTPNPVTECLGGDAAAIDPAYGAGTYCSSRDPSHAATLLADSIASGDDVRVFNKCDVRVLLGSQDLHTGVAESQDWLGLPVIRYDKMPIAAGCIADSAHPLPDALDGAARIVSDIEQYCKVR